MRRETERSEETNKSLQGGAARSNEPSRVVTRRIINKLISFIEQFPDMLRSVELSGAALRQVAVRREGC